MNLLYIVIATLLLVAVLTFVSPWMNQKIAEPFQGSSAGCPVLPPSQADVMPPAPDPVTFQEYIDEGKRANNRTAGMLTDTQVNALSGISSGPTSFNEQMRQALTTSMVQPTVPEDSYTDTRPVELIYGPSTAQGILRSFAGIIGYKMSDTSGIGPDMTQPWTFFDRKPSYVEESIPVVSDFAEDVAMCEKVNAFAFASDGQNGASKKNREQLCVALNDGSLGATCGVCLRGGTTYTQLENNAKLGIPDTMRDRLRSFIGGMFLSERDRSRQRASTAIGSATSYKPSAGTCDDGYFFVAGQEDACLNAASKLACLEYGSRGGFRTDGSKVVTDDGRIANELLEKCVVCQQDPGTYLVSGGGTHPLRIRIVTPAGTGMTNIFYRVGSTGTYSMQRIGAGQAESIQLPIIRPTNVLEFIVYQEFPHRPRGDREVFLAAGVFSSFSDAKAYCESLDATVASLDQLQEAYNAGTQVHVGGYASNEKIYTVHQYSDYDKAFPSKGIGIREVETAGGVWCYGIRPAKGFYAQSTQGSTTVFEKEPKILNWFEYIKRVDDALLNDDEKQDRYSRFGNIVDRANYRGVIIQMESGTDVLELQKRRRDSAERYIVNVGDTDITDYTLERKLKEIYSRNGLFSNSLKIVEPRPVSPAISNIPLIPSQYWLWSSDHKSNSFKFKVEVPGFFRDPEFADDLAKCPTGILFANGVSLARGIPSACENGPSDACLREIFKRVGGDPVKGDLGPENSVNGVTNRRVLRYKDFLQSSGAFSALPESSLMERTVDEIESFLMSIAENAAGKNLPLRNPGEDTVEFNKRILEIIQQAQRNLLGTSGGGPCDILTYNRDANTYSIVRKEALTLNLDTYDARNPDIQCMQSIYNDKNTYTNLSDAYSGISDTEIAASFVRNAFPLQACQPSGSWVPIKEDGSVDPAVIAAIRQAADAFDTTQSGTSVVGIQKVFADIHTKANNETDVAVQKESVERCYGIVRKELPSNCLGIQTQRIRILPSAFMFNGAPDNTAIHILEGGITVKDSTGECVGNPVYSAVYNLLSGTELPNYMNGVYVDKQDSGEYNVRRSVVELSFGLLKNVQAIEYKVPSDSAPVTGMVFQILDNSSPPKVMVQKVLTSIGDDSSSVNLVFSMDDMIPTIPYRSIATGMEFRLETAIFPDLYLRRPRNTQDGQYTLRIETDSVFAIMDDINGSKRTRVCSIFHKTSATYISYSPTTRSLVYIPKDEANIMNRSWASWAIQPALNGSSAHVVVESANYPGQFLMPLEGQARVGVDVVDFTSEFDKFRACWTLKPGE